MINSTLDTVWKKNSFFSVFVLVISEFIKYDIISTLTITTKLIANMNAPMSIC